MSHHEILIETKQIGAALRIAAVHVATGTEVVFQAPASISQTALQKLAADKLRYVMERKR